tara:strand:- start:455 stop:577 length:123 start_codon:yes stop_codon:yes gene_type:complete
VKLMIDQLMFLALCIFGALLLALPLIAIIGTVRAAWSLYN